MRWRRTFGNHWPFDVSEWASTCRIIAETEQWQGAAGIALASLVRSAQTYHAACVAADRGSRLRWEFPAAEMSAVSAKHSQAIVRHAIFV